MKRRRQRSIGRRLRLYLAKARSDRPGVGHRRCVELRDRAGETGFRHVAERTSLVPVDRQPLIEQQQLAEEDRSLRWPWQTLAQIRQCFRLDPIDLSHDSSDFCFGDGS
jgi:hypothetical protein